MSSLDQTVQQVLETGRVGTPVFVRWIAHVTPGHLKESLVEMLMVTQSWFRAKPKRLYIQGGEDTAQITASVLYTDGQTALVTVAAAPSDRSAYADLMLLGNRGAIYHDGIPPSRFVETSTAVEPPPASLLDAIERSLKRRQPVYFEGVNEDA